MGLTSLFFVFAVALAGPLATGKSTDALEGYKLLSVFAKSTQEVAFLHRLQEEYPELDFWTYPSLIHESKMLLPPKILHTVELAMSREGIKWNESGVDVQQIVLDGMRKVSVPSSPRKVRRAVNEDIIDHNNFHTYAEIVNYFHKLEKANPDIVSISHLHYPTQEGRRVIMMKLHTAKGSSNKPSIIVEAGMHAREWAAPASLIYSAETLIKIYRLGGKTEKLMLDKYDWYIVPVSNPDGYEFTHQDIKRRLWRKNKRLAQILCTGVDLNRNFDIRFGETGISKDCKSLIYDGVNPFSEPETANFRHLFLSIKDSVVAFLSVHAFGQMIILPWTYSVTGEKPDNYEELNRVANNMAQAMKNVDGKVYKVGSVYDLLNYASSGSTIDWALNEKPGIYAIAYEMRPSLFEGRSFNLPPNEIHLVGEELYASLKSLALNMKLPK